MSKILHEDRRWVINQTNTSVEITDLLADKTKATVTLSGTAGGRFRAQLDKAAPEDRHDLITEWYHS